ncbi:IS200/IS605 family transposase [Lutibacter sp. HS1-25]|uniref:IS200/IS605 family transposase n=1 Tax=Lutibacter sp. HS1-25 TaxID=2485000 RepID=UPI00101126DA|nr:IS200/IS605 family transposase [Lutibacter sp. HS1-25]RXP56555.1 IS200/IS605 family transposase [Lutibacter sp. HS1-25]RXP59392.1 IS200/IS605 family transposase [Lutibacter sp. HS1-25]
MSSSIHIHKRHNVSLLLYHLVCSTKYRRLVLSPKVDRILKKTCLDIQDRYEIHFLEIGTDKNHVHFLIQSVPTYSPTKIARTIKSITAREIFLKAPGVKRALWGGSFWGSGFYVNTVGRHGNEKIIAAYVKNQGLEDEYDVLHKDSQLNLF